MGDLPAELRGGLFATAATPCLRGMGRLNQERAREACIQQLHSSHSEPGAAMPVAQRGSTQSDTEMCILPSPLRNIIQQYQ